MVVFIILLFMLSVDASSETKYIDLLPDKEKYEFLQLIARRILDEVPSGTKKDPIPSVTKDELDAHTDFINKIIKEEEANFKANNKENNTYKAKINVKPLERNRHQSHIDLTLRSRTKRDDNESKNNGGEESSLSAEKDIQVKKQPVIRKDDDLKTTIEVNQEESTTVLEVNEEIHTKIDTGGDSTKTMEPTEINQSFTHTNGSLNIKINTNNENEPYVQNNNDENTTQDTLLKEIAEEESQSTVDDVTDITTENEPTIDVNKVEIVKDSSIINIKKGNTDVEETINDTNKPHVGEDRLIPRLRSENSDISKDNGLNNIEKPEDIHLITSKATTIGNPDTVIEKIQDSQNSFETTAKIIDATEFKDIETTEKVTDKGHTDIEHVDLNERSADTVKVTKPKINVEDENKKESTETNKPEKKSIFIDLETLQKETKPVLDKSGSENFETIIEINKNKTDVNTPHLRSLAEEYINKDISTNNNFKNHLKPKHLIDTKIENTNEATTEKIKVLTPKPLDVTKIVDSLEIIENNLRKEKDDAKNIIKRLRQALRPDNGKLDESKSVNKLRPHEVYEISPDAPPFARTKEININEEQPNIVPIYNYSPKNAYYNGINNYGPNPSDIPVKRISNNIETDKENNFQTDNFLPSGERNQYQFWYRMNPKESERMKTQTPSDVEYIKCSFENPEIQRSCKNRVKEKPVDDSLKQSVRHARNYLYQKKYFGAIDFDKNYTSFSEELLGDDKKKVFRSGFRPKIDLTDIQSNNDDDNNNIAMDYFSTRNDDQKDRTKTHLVEKQNEILSKLINRIAQAKDYKIYHLNRPLKSLNKPKHLRYQKEEKKPNLEEIKKVLEFTPEADLIPTLNKLLNMKTVRNRDEDNDIEIFVDVLADMVQSNNRELVKYDWLGTAVDTQGAVAKLIALSDLVLNKKYINPLDYELLKYIVFIHKQAAKAMNIEKEIMRFKIKLPRVKLGGKRNWIKNIGHIFNQGMYRVKSDQDTVVTKTDINNFKLFLKELQNKLNEIHNALKHIAGITKYHHQNWFKNLKELYLDSSRTKTLELLLHLSLSKVLDSIEKSASKGLEEDYVHYTETNVKEFEELKTEFVFLMKILMAMI